MALFGVRQTSGSMASADWPHVQGTIIHAARRSPSTQVHVVYEYTVDGTSYRAFRYSFGKVL